MQGILGTSSKNPLFSVDINNEENVIVIYFGFAVLTTIPNNKDSLIFKSTIAILLNAGVCASHIEKAFNLTYKTIKKYSTAFNSANDEELLKSNLRNPGREIYKVSDEILSYIHERSDFYKSENKKHFHQELISDIETNFGVRLSRDTIRLSLKKEKPAKEIVKEYNDFTSGDKIIPFPIDSKEQVIPAFRNSYTGIFLLSSYLSLVFNDFPNFEVMGKKYSMKAFYIWLCFGVLLGAKNLESMRYFNIKDFEYVSGYSGFPTIEKMRESLNEISLLDDTRVATFLLKKNIDYFVEESGDYYIDGHFEEYTGKANILSGWHTIKNRVCKGVYDYFVHDGAGNPIFTALQDTFYDFREVIKKLLSKIKDLRSKKPLTLIYDRGGFSTELMKEISKDDNQYFITWQKGFKKKEANKVIFEKSITIELPYNDLGKFKSYNFLYGEDTWKCNDYECRRIVFEKKTKNDEKFYQSILTNDKECDGGIIIKKILARSRQENDFKKQKAHFGIDEITSYKKLNCGELGDKDPDKQANNKDYKNKLKIINNLKVKRKVFFEKIGIEIYNQSDIKKIPTDVSKKNKKTINEINKLNSKIKLEEKTLKKIEKKISKLEKCKNEKRQELDLRAKRNFTLIKITSRNILELAAKYFLGTYHNLRDYQKVFRKLIRTGGEISVNNQIMYIKLDSFGGKKFRQKCNEFFHKFNNEKIKTPDGKYILHFQDF